MSWYLQRTRVLARIQLSACVFSEEIIELILLENVMWEISKLALDDEKYTELVSPNLNFRNLTDFQAKS